MATGNRTRAKQAAPEDVYRSTLTFDDREGGGAFIRKHPWDLIAASRDDKGRVVLTYYLSRTQIKALEKEGYPAEVHENVSEIGRARQKEIASGDRFEGGRVTPKSRAVAARGGK